MLAHWCRILDSNFTEIVNETKERVGSLTINTFEGEKALTDLVTPYTFLCLQYLQLDRRHQVLNAF